MGRVKRTFKDPMRSLRGRVVRDENGNAVNPMVNREAWKVIRRPRIGSSDMPAIFGKDEYKGPWDIWDRIVLGDWDNAEGGDIRRGVKQEKVARATFVERTGLDALALPMVEHAKNKRIVTDTDGLIVHPGKRWPEAVKDSEVWSPVMGVKGHGWMELKVPRIARFYQFKEEGIPQAHVIQAQCHGMVTGLDWGFFAFYTPEYDDLIAFPVLTDWDFCDWMERAAKKWLVDYVDAEVRPERSPPEPPMWPDPIPGEATVRDDEKWRFAASVLVQKHYDLLEAEQHKAEAEAEMVALLGEGEQHVAGAGVKVTRGSTASQRRMDFKKFRAEMKLRQKHSDRDGLMDLDPDDDEWKYSTKTSEKVKVDVFASNPEEEF
jgi:hypothetical protein